MPEHTPRIALITGSAQRIGAKIATHLHSKGFNLALHYHNSAQRAEQLHAALNAQRPASAKLLRVDLLDTHNLPALIDTTLQHWGRLDVLINNASTFYPTLIGEITEQHWHDLLGTNLKAPLFLSQAAAPHLKTNNGSIINIVDIHSERPMRQHPVYSIAKAGLAALTKSLAKELAPHIRVNGISPGAILWPEHGMDQDTRAAILNRVPMARPGEPQDIARTVEFLIEAPYITGQIIAVDGGRSLSM